MCTVSIIPLSDDRAGLRIVCNRDEQRTRPAAQAPSEQRYGQRRALLPRDPAGGGTWIAANDAGVVLMLLNVNDPLAAPCVAPGPQRRSRGLIIPSLLHLSNVDAMIQRCLRMRATEFKPFRLMIASIGGCVELHSDGAVIRCRGAVLPQRVAMFTSSGLGDHVVELPRRKLFEECLGDGQHSVARQDLFHQHQWNDRPHQSVKMSRADARTVSRTIIELMSDQIVMHYAALDERGLETDRTTCLLLVSVESADDDACNDPDETSGDAIMLQGAAE